MRKDIGVYTCVCEPDAVWIGQYLAEIERLELPFAIHLDRCSVATTRLVIDHPNCVGFTEQRKPSIEFEERHKQGVFDIVVAAGCQWAMAWDVDETWERDAPEKLDKLAGIDGDYIVCPWVNLWGDTRHIRVDGAFKNGQRVKFYRLNRTWRFDHPITNGAKSEDAVKGHLDLTCLHHGMMTRELRLQHKERWDRIYSAAVGENPYGFWRFACDETIEPTIVEHGL